MSWCAEIAETSLRASFRQSGKKELCPNSIANLTNRERTQEISQKGRRKLRKAVTALSEAILEISKSDAETIKSNCIELTFATLTLPAAQVHTDQEIKRKAFNTFLQYFRKYYEQHEIIWRAEAQKNGNIHFHIIFTRRIPHKTIREVWNRAMARMGYVERYAEKMRKLSLSEYIRQRRCKDKEAVQAAIKAYKKGVAEDWQNPNSTDIHSLEKVKNVASYIAKYVSKKKEDGRRLIQGKVYGISRGIGKMNMALLTDSEEVLSIIEDCIEQGIGDVYADKYYCVIYLREGKFSQYSSRLKALLYENHQNNLSILIHRHPT